MAGGGLADTFATHNPPNEARNMQERIYTLKKGTEVPEQFDGVTVPYTVAGSFEEIETAAGSKDAALNLFNQALALWKQKNAKQAASDENATVETIREAAAETPETVRVRGSGGPRKATVDKAAEALSALGITLTDEQLAAFREQMKAKKTEK
jgi:hypothetical protein